MATGTGPCRSAPADQSPDELGEDDLRVVFKALHSVAKKYMFLGVEMKVKMSEIEKIQSQCSDPDECLLKVLSIRLRKIPSLTWRDVDTALRSDTVGEPQLADRVRRQYGHLYSPDPSFEASLDQEQGRKMSKITKSKKKAKKEKSAKKYVQQDSDEEVSESERYRKPSKRVQMEVNEAVVKKTQQRAKKSPYGKRHSKPEKEYIEKELKHKGETQRKKKATKYDKESRVVCGSQHRHKVKHSEQRAQKEVQIECESESSASSSEQEIIQIDNSDSTEESNSSEQEEDSAEEVSETERYQKPSEQPKEDEYPHSQRETPVRKIKGKRGKSSDLEKTKFESQSKAEVKAKQKKKMVDQSVSNEASQHEMAGDVHGKHERVAQERKQKKSEKHSTKGVQKAPRENESESSAMRREEETVSSSYHRGKSRKPKSVKDMYQQKQSQGKKLEYQTKATAKKEVKKKAKESISVAGEQSSDEEVREKPAPKSLRQKEVQTKSESEDESSSASTSDDGSELHLHESTRMKEYHKVHPNSDGNEIEKERAVKTRKEAKVTKRKGFHSFDTDVREQSRKAERSTKVDQKMKKTTKEKYLKVNTSPRKEIKEQTEKERISSRKKVIEQNTPYSDGTQKDSEDEESDSDDSSEDEEDRDSEQKSSNEEEETEPDDESSPDTSEEEVKRKPAVPYMKEIVKETRGRKGKRVKIAVDVQDLTGNEDESDPGDGSRDQEEHDIQPKKTSRRRHRESSMSPTARGSSSPSTSQEEGQRQIDSKEQKGKNKKRENHKKRRKSRATKEKGEASDSSPECDRSSENEKLRINIFERFYGQLCCEISNPVEIAAQLHMKGLISKAVMKMLITSPESQQVKTINLVDELDETIKSKPDCLFTFIKVLLENDALQRVGREILIEAGIL